jgi:hypothetical protein
VSDATRIVRTCEGCQFYARQTHLPTLFTTFSFFGEHNMSEDYTKVGELLGATTKDELWSGVEAFVFAEDSNSLSIHL